MKKTSLQKNTPFLTSEDEAQFFNSIVEYVGEELMLIDSEGRIVYVNDAAAKGLGYSKDYLLNKRIISFFKQKTTLASWKKEHRDPLRKKRKPVSLKLDRVVKGGDVQTIRITVASMRFKSQDYTLSVGHNITEATRIRRRLEESEHLYRILCEGAADGILTFDLKGKITYINSATEKMTKISSKDSVGTPFVKYISKKAIPRALLLFSTLVKTKKKIHDEVEIIDRNGQHIPIEFHGTPLIRNGKVFAVHVVIRDMRKRKQLETLQIESEKMKAMNQFIAGTTQEIKYPLQAVLGRLKNISDIYQKKDFEYIGYREYKEVMDTIENVRHQVKYCYDTISRLVNINRKRTKFVEKKCDANKIIKESVGLIDEQFMQPNIKIHLKLKPGLPIASISEMDLSEAIVNLLTNAVQSMPAGGVVTIKTSFESKRNRIVIKVRDQGIGIKKEYLSQIFEPFFTTKQRGLEKSSGLGLSIVYSIIRSHRGDIFVESSLRHGTSVAVELLPCQKKSNLT